MFKKYFLTFFFAVIMFPAISQNCDYMYTSVKTPSGIIITGKISQTIYDGPAIPVISMISQEGEILWQIEDTMINLGFIGIAYYDDLHVYLRVVKNSYESATQIWKLSLLDGEIIWKSQLFPTDNDEISSIQNYNETHFLFYYGIVDNNGGTIAGYRIFLMDKSDSSVTQIHEYTGSLTTFKPILDKNKNLLIGYRLPGNSDNFAYIRKINGLNFNSIIWDKSFNYNGWNQASLNDIDEMIIDKFNNLYALGSGDMFKINVNNGTEIWKIASFLSETRITDYKFFDNFLYISSAHIYVGATVTQFRVSKINLTNGTRLWTSYEANMTPVGAEIPSSTGDHEATLSFDLDCQGNVFATGYYGSANYGPGAWGIMKISSQTGQKMSDLTVTNNPLTLNLISSGRAAHVFNDEPIFIGNLQYSSDDSARVFVKTDNDLSEINSKIYHCFIDSDNDSIADWDEDINGVNFLSDDDTDNDGQPNYLDNDDDGDGIPTILEDANGDGNPLNDFSDPLQPTLPDYLNPAITLSVDEKDMAFMIYPNPTKDLLKLHSSGYETFTAKIFTIGGVEVLNCSENCNSLDLSHFASGMYFIKVSNGEYSLTKKIIKE